jgi:hypothetical protein
VRRIASRTHPQRFIRAQNPDLISAMRQADLPATPIDVASNQAKLSTQSLRSGQAFELPQQCRKGALLLALRKANGRLGSRTHGVQVIHAQAPADPTTQHGN